MHVSQLDRVRVCVDTALAISMECTMCTEKVQWDAANKWWACSCGIEMTVDEAKQVLQRARAVMDKAIGGLGGEPRKKKQGFVGWLKKLMSSKQRNLKLPPSRS